MQIGLNSNETYLTGYGPQHFFTNQFRSARSYRLFGGATVDAHGYPAATEAGNPLSRVSYTMSHWQGGMPEPYHGSFALLVDGAAEITIKRKDAKGGTIETLYREPHSGPRHVAITIPPCAVDSCLHVTARHVTQPMRTLALVHADHLLAHAAGIGFNPDYLALIAKAGGVWRTMKLTRTDDDPEGVTIAGIDDLDWTGSHPGNRRGVPYEAIIQAAAWHGGITPWLALNAAITDAEVDGLAAVIARHDIPLYLEYTNEVFHGPKGGSPHHYLAQQAEAKWGITPDKARAASYGRQWLAWRFSQIIERLEAAGVRHLIKTVYADQGNWSGWVPQTFGAPYWARTAHAARDTSRYNRWSSGSMVDVFAFNAYYGERLLPKFDANGNITRPGFITMAEKDDPAAVLAGLAKGADLRSNQIAGVKKAIATRLPGKQYEWAAYEGGISDSRGLVSHFQRLPEMETAHAHWLQQCEKTAALDLVMHYADLSGGSWRLFPHVRADLADTPKSRALMPYVGQPAPPVPAPIPPQAVDPVTPPVAGSETEQPEEGTGPQAPTPPDMAALIADARRALDAIEAAL